MPYTREQYEAERRGFRWNIPESYNIAAMIDAHAQRKGGQPAVLWEAETGERRTLTWQQLSQLSARCAAVLMRLGVRKGDPVLHIFPRLPEAFIAQIGTFKAGAVAVPCVDMLRAKDIIYRAEVSGARVVVAHVSVAEEVDAARGQCPLEHFLLIGGRRPGWLSFEEEIEKAPEVPPVPLTVHDPITINFTSGTTG
ncbi:MAG: AMP-binding protein, partial [Candidatus Bipolaricaulota bacterium]|nr:AMP-binding protein [Candidatus Bipolaricaulota bacterium]MDW8126892.1 AMP-binding protein [Candidatus Bipolaricaulota bacterium]